MENLNPHKLLVTGSIPVVATKSYEIPSYLLSFL